MVVSESIVSQLQTRISELEKKIEVLLNNQETSQAILEVIPDNIFILDNEYVF